MNIDTSFVPLELDGASWSALEPLAPHFETNVDDAADLEQLLLDRSELDAGQRSRQSLVCRHDL